ncbi:uncharacterized protein [Argopecten irradians]|uniref:uncharacterized protein n=1 Tax=Argopecten irradians TaxID=31199 RepID=UPI003719D888
MNTSVNFSTVCFQKLGRNSALTGTTGCVIICLNVCAFVAMALSKSIVERVRVPLMMLCVSNFVFGVSFIFSLYQHLCRAGGALVAFAMVLLYTVTFLISVDRCICLNFEMAYMKYITNKRVRVLYVAVWIIVAIVTYGRDISIDTDNAELHQKVKQSSERMFVILELVAQILTVTCSVSTIIRIWAIQSRMPNSKESFQNTVKLLHFICIYQFMIMPSLLHRLVWTAIPDLKKSLKAVRLIADIVKYLSCIVIPLLFMLRFRDCRLSMLQMVCWWNKKFHDRIKYKKKQLLAPFLQRRSDQNVRETNSPNPVGVCELTTSQECVGTEMAQRTSTISVIDVDVPGIQHPYRDRDHSQPD